jgi:hypothetical protein
MFQSLPELLRQKAAFTLVEFALIGGIVAVAVLGLFGVFGNGDRPLPSIALF